MSTTPNIIKETAAAQRRAIRDRKVAEMRDGIVRRNLTVPAKKGKGARYARTTKHRGRGWE